MVKFGNRYQNPNPQKECYLNPGSKVGFEDFEAVSEALSVFQVSFYPKSDRNEAVVLEARRGVDDLSWERWTCELEGLFSERRAEK